VEITATGGCEMNTQPAPCSRDPSLLILHSDEAASYEFRFVAGQEIFFFSKASNSYGSHRLSHLMVSDAYFPEGEAAGT
jgi:hypothetical protein